MLSNILYLYAWLVPWCQQLEIVVTRVAHAGVIYRAMTCCHESSVWVALPQQTKPATVSVIIGKSARDPYLLQHAEIQVSNNLKGCCLILHICLTLGNKSFLVRQSLLCGHAVANALQNNGLHVLTHHDMCRLQICGTLPSTDSASGHLHYRFSRAICH